MTTLQVPDCMGDVDSVEVMAAYLPEPERADVDDDGVPRDDSGSAFSSDSYWVVANSGVTA